VPSAQCGMDQVLRARSTDQVDIGGGLLWQGRAFYT